MTDPVVRGEGVSKVAFAKIIGKSPRTVSNMIDDGLPVAAGGGKGTPLVIDTAAAIEWMIARESARFDPVDGGGEGDADARLKQARYEKLQLEIDAKRRTLVPVTDAVNILMRIAAVFATQLDALPARLAPGVAILSDPAEIQHKIFGETRRARAATADKLVDAAHRLAADINQGDTYSGADGDSPAAEIGE